MEKLVNVSHHRDTTKRLSVFTDASDTNLSDIITQVLISDLDKPQKDYRHEPLDFLSGRFNATKRGWYIVTKEGLAALTTLKRIHWISVVAEGVDIYTNSKNLIFIFDPLLVMVDMSQTSLRKVPRWTVQLCMYKCVCYHKKGEDNVLDDLLTRW